MKLLVHLKISRFDRAEKLWRLTTLFLAALTVSGQTAKEQEPRPYDFREAYEVYAAALALDHTKGELLISDTTVPFNECLDSALDKLTKDAIDGYKEANRTSWRLQQGFRLKQQYRLLSHEQIEKLRRPDPNGGFFWRFPRAISIIRFSAVGFSSDRSVAFLEMDVICGGLCGHGRAFVLQKRNGTWREYAPVVQHPDGTFEMSGSCSWNY